MADELDYHGIQITLYSLVVSQIHKYAVIFWQFPIALIAANTFVFDKFKHDPFVLIIVACFDAILIYAFHVLVTYNRSLIKTAQTAEDILRENFNDFIPTFKTPKIKATTVTIIGMWAIPLILLIYSIVLLRTCGI